MEHINAGSLQRIADATELMAKNHASLVADRDNYQRWYQQEKDRKSAAIRSNTSLKGQITKLRKQLAAWERAVEKAGREG